MQQVLKLNSQPNLRFYPVSNILCNSQSFYVNSWNKTQYFRLCLSDKVYAEFWLGKTRQTDWGFVQRGNQCKCCPRLEADLFVYCVTLLPELNVTEDVRMWPMDWAHREVGGLGCPLLASPEHGSQQWATLVTCQQTCNLFMLARWNT